MVQQYGEAEVLGNATTNRTRGAQCKAEVRGEAEAWQEAEEVNALADNRRQHNDEALEDIMQRPQRTGAPEVSTECFGRQPGEWQRQ